MQAVDHACDISRAPFIGLDIDEWHEMIDEMVTLLHAHKASEANR